MDYYQTIEESLVYIEDHLEEPLTLDGISREFNISKYYFNRLFSSVMGTSLKQYVLFRKLNDAVKRIYSGKDSLTRIGYDLNFGNQASFTRSFKKQYGIAPSLLKSEEKIEIVPIPKVVKRKVKNFNGDIVTDFTLTLFEPVQLTGVVFEIDLAKENFKDEIYRHARALEEAAGGNMDTSRYMVYSNCRPGSSKFNAMYGVPKRFETDMENVFTIQIPEIFCAKFKYHGDLLKISDTFVSDYGKFLKLSKRKTQGHDIELIQVFNADGRFMENYDIFVPIEKTEDELEDF